LDKLNNFDFTNRENSIGCVYVVRDPRNVITSLKNFYELNDDQALNGLQIKTNISMTFINLRKWI
jgi:hypothetical protein